MLAGLFLSMLSGACVERADVRDREDGRILYTEERNRESCETRSGKELVRYLDPAGREFGTKTIVHRDGTLPEVRLAQKVPDREVEVRIRGSYAMTTLRDKGKTRSARVELPQGAVFDAGIDVWIASRLEGIAAGEKPLVPILLPEFGRVLVFEARSLEGADRGEVRVELVPRSRILRFLADPLVATYDRATGRLVAYEGVSDIKDADGRNHDVRLRYRTTSS